MKRLAALGIAVVSFAALAACTETKVVEEVDPGLANPQAPAGEDPLAKLAPDWQERAASYLNKSSKAWLTSPPNVGQNVDCAMSCHTTFSTVLARGHLSGMTMAAADDARSQFESRVTESSSGNATPFYGKSGDAKTKESAGSEAILNAVALSFDDLNKGSALSADAKKALDHMWDLQRADGAWDWLEFGLEPWETRNDWGAAMAALVAGSVPEGTSSAQAAGTKKLIGYLQGNITSMALHDRAATLWANGALSGLLEASQAEAVAAALDKKQRDDGGFALPMWGKGELAAKDAESDGYATALAVLALCKGMPDGYTREDVQAALKWLASNQKDDGSWFGQSVNSTSSRAEGFMTDAATAYAVIALTTCAPPKSE